MKQSISLFFICAVIGLALGILSAEAFMHTDLYANSFLESVEISAESLTTVVNNSVDDVNNSVEVEEVLQEELNVASEEFTKPRYTEKELEILAIIIYQEAGGDNCTDDTRRKVGSVFLNRVNSPLFPDTFEGVATQKSQYGTLYRTGIKWPDRASNSQEKNAVKRAYTIAEELLINGSILPDNVIWQAEFIQGDGIYAYQDDIYFCYSKR